MGQLLITVYKTDDENNLALVGNWQFAFSLVLITGLWLIMKIEQGRLELCRPSNMCQLKNDYRSVSYRASTFQNYYYLLFSSILCFPSFQSSFKLAIKLNWSDISDVRPIARLSFLQFTSQVIGLVTVPFYTYNIVSRK